jgi:hypothetical protein
MMLCVLEITLVSCCFELPSVAILYICLRVQAPLSLPYHMFLHYIPPLFQGKRPYLFL